MPRRKASPVKLKHNPRYSSLLARQEIDLHCGDSQSLLGHFQWANTALYHLGVTLPKRTTTKQTEELKGVVYDAIRQIEESLQAEYARINLLHENCGQKPDISFSKPLKTTVDLAHPESRRLLDLLVGFDRMQRQLSELWFARQIDNRTYLTVRTNCRNALKEGLKSISQLVRQAKARTTENPDVRKHPRKTEE